MKRLMVSLVLIGVVSVLVGIDPAFARAHRDDYASSIGTLWQIVGGVVCLLVFFGSMMVDGPIDRKKQQKENEEFIKKEKAKEGVLKYYGKPILWYLIYLGAPFAFAITLGWIL
jgi:hypothetical protein